MHKDIYSAFKLLDDVNWVEILCLTPQHPKINGVLFPGFPPPDIQVGMVGSAYEQALREVAAFYREIRAYSQRVGLTFTDDTRMLDFGCGYGRILRFFMKDVAPGNLVGTDVDPSFINICRDIFQGGQFDINPPYPPLAYPDASFDIIYAYSVFTHLSEDAHLAWLKELRRIVKPDGLVFLTLRQRSFLYQCHQLRQQGNLSVYDKYIAEAFGDFEAVMKPYVLGEYIYKHKPSGGGGGVRTPDFYGDTVVSPMYIKEKWFQYFETVDLFDDLKRMAQALIVLQPR